MNDIRILIPWEEARNLKIPFPYDQLDYCEFSDHLTRPITPEDIRSCLRMPDDWTDEERDAIFIYLTEDICDVDTYSNHVLDIALRPAPEEDPWELMDEWVKAFDKYGDTRVSMIWTELKKAEGK